MSQYNKEDKSKSQEWIQTGNWFLDQAIKSGITQGGYNIIIGKSRQTGKSYYTEQMYIQYLKQYIFSIRKRKIKKILESI